MQSRRLFLGCGISLALAAAALPANETSPGPVMAPRDVIDRTRTKIVILKTASGTRRSSATGFLARPGLVITAGHAVREAGSITAWLNGVSYRAETIDTHPDYDLALLSLRAPALQLKPVELSRESASLAKDEELIVLAGPSQPAGATGDPTTRIPIPAFFVRLRSLRESTGRIGPALELRASVERGDSGSPVLRIRDGSVVGVLSSRELPDTTGVSRVAYAVPVEAVHSWLRTAAPPQPSTGPGDFYLFGR